MARSRSYPIYSSYIESELKIVLRKINPSYAAFLSFCIDTGEIPSKAEKFKVKDIKHKTVHEITCAGGMVHRSQLSVDTMKLIALACANKSDDDFVFTASGKPKECMKRTSFYDTINRTAESLGYHEAISYKLYKKQGIHTVNSLLGLGSIYRAYDYLGIRSEDQEMECEKISAELSTSITQVDDAQIEEIHKKLQSFKNTCSQIQQYLDQGVYTKPELLLLNNNLDSMLLTLSTCEPHTHI